MKPPIFRRLKYLAPASVFAIVLAVAALSMRQPAANAGSPPPDVPDFTGESSHDTLFRSDDLSQATVNVNGPQAGWVTIIETDFEDENWKDQWLNISLKDVEPKYKYGTRDIVNDLDPLSTKVAWAVGQGEPELDPAADGYPAKVHAWLVAGPFDFTDVLMANLAFEYSFEADEGDKFRVSASIDQSKFIGTEINGGAGGWVAADVDLSSYAGEPTVWIAFIFESDDSASAKLGLLLDNVKLDVEYPSKTHLPFITYGIPNVTPTPTITPGDSYFKGFSNNIDPWVKVRWSDGADSELSHSDTCDGDICGFLNLKVDKTDHYAIVSPKEPSKPYPYTIETEAKIRSPRHDKDSYGIIFGASTNGQVCPVNDFSTCFNHYYELRVRYRDSGGNQWIEFKLVRVEGHDENNQPIGTDLIGWTEINEDPDSVVEWDVKVKENGDIVIKADEDKVGEANDGTFLNNPYFGLIVTSGPNGSSEVKFGYYEVK